MKNKLTRWFLYEWGITAWQKPYFVILRSPLSRIHYYHNKWLQVKKSQSFIPTYSWTLTPIPNWTCSVVTISHFQCMAPSTWLTNLMRRSLYATYSPSWERMLVAKFFSSSHDEDQKPPWSQNPKVYKQSSFFKKTMK